MSVLRREPRVVYRVYSRQDYLAGADMETDREAPPATCVDDTPRARSPLGVRLSRRRLAVGRYVKHTPPAGLGRSRGGMHRRVAGAVVAGAIAGAVGIVVTSATRRASLERRSAEVSSGQLSSRAPRYDTRLPQAARRGARRALPRGARRSRRPTVDGAGRSRAGRSGRRAAERDRAGDTAPDMRLVDHSTERGPAVDVGTGRVGAPEDGDFGFEQ